MRAYGMSHPETMRLPMKVFWHLSGSVPRLLDDERKGVLEILAASKTPTGMVALQERLDLAAPEPIKHSMNAFLNGEGAVRDQAGVEQLRAMAG